MKSQFFLTTFLFIAFLTAFSKKATPTKTEINGYVDMHTHLAAHIAFGGSVFHGTPDGDKANLSIDQVLGQSCCSTHGGLLRKQLLKQMELGQGGKALHGRKNTYKTWTQYNDITHQHMWVEWLRRSANNGLKIMVALATNSRTLADAIGAKKATDDKTSADLQIAEMKALVQRHSDFMAIAYSPEEARTIVDSGKLAIILGVEIDNIGNLNQVKNLTNTMIQAEIQRLYQNGVRYIFPIHVTDNPFGGTAIYEPFFNYANRRESGAYWDIDCADSTDGIAFHFQPEKFPKNLPINILKALKFGITANPPKPPDCKGHKNKKGLTLQGELAIKEMMRLGMMIDIDHMSQNSVSRTLQIAYAYNYPLNAGHNGLRGEAGTENGRTLGQVDTIAHLGGLFGVGWGGADSYSFMLNFQKIWTAMGAKNTAIGTDINGLVVSPSPPRHTKVIYNSLFTMCKTGNLTWDYNKMGVAHYGLLPDFIRDIENHSGGKEVIENFNKSAEYFVQMWEKCEKQKKAIP